MVGFVADGITRLVGLVLGNPFIVVESLPLLLLLRIFFIKDSEFISLLLTPPPAPVPDDDEAPLLLKVDIKQNTGIHKTIGHKLMNNAVVANKNRSNSSLFTTSLPEGKRTRNKLSA